MPGFAPVDWQTVIVSGLCCFYIVACPGFVLLLFRVVAGGEKL